MKTGLKVALPGQEVDTEDSKKLAFNIDKQPLATRLGRFPSHFGKRTYKFVSNPATPGTPGQTVVYPLFEIEHNLGYIPASALFTFLSENAGGANIIDDESFYSGNFGLNSSSGQSQNIGYYVTDKKLVIYFSIRNMDDLGPFTYNNMTGVELDFKYYLFVPPGLDS